ncbi:MAG: CPBP family intramembrane metalloprotease [Pirellulaceae bacterium]|nr:CPBP family intramembrane metalloprotease [Pirellulaceae bacterium]
MGDPTDFVKDDEPEADGLDGHQPHLPDVKDAAVSPALTVGTIWGEVCAVLSIGVVPYILYAGISLRLPPSDPLPYWLDAIQATVMSGCTIFVTLYLIYRSGEPWGSFGITRPSVADVLLGIALLLAHAAFGFCFDFVAWRIGATSDHQFPWLEQTADYGLMVLKVGVSAFSEELVTRAYLITRFESLLRSRGAAVLLPAALFGTYHGYQGVAGMVFWMAVGLMYGMAFLLLRRIWPLAIAHTLYNIWWQLAT